MPTNYPSGLDSFSARGALMSNTPQHGSVHDDLADAIEAMQVEMGAVPSGTYPTVRSRLDSLDQLRRVYADVASLPGSGEFTGQRVWVIDGDREYTWDGTSHAMPG